MGIQVWELKNKEHINLTDSAFRYGDEIQTARAKLVQAAIKAVEPKYDLITDGLVDGYVLGEHLTHKQGGVDKSVTFIYDGTPILKLYPIKFHVNLKKGTIDYRFKYDTLEQEAKTDE